MAQPDRRPISAAIAHLNAYMFVHHPGVWIAEWNDQPGRTAWQVALLLRRAAAWTPATVDTLALAA